MCYRAEPAGLWIKVFQPKYRSPQDQCKPLCGAQQPWRTLVLGEALPVQNSFELS